jgi:hypothetical protein
MVTLMQLGDTRSPVDRISWTVVSVLSGLEFPSELLLLHLRTKGATLFDDYHFPTH